MMELYLLRHGIAEEGSAGQSDADRALTAEGKRKLHSVVKVAMNAGCAPSLIVSSPYKRAVQTAQIAADGLKYKGELLRAEALIPSSNPASVWDEVRVHREEPQLLLTGHDPLFTDLAGYLLGFPGLRIDFKKGAIVRIDFDKFSAEPRGTLKWMLVPKIAGA
jgi:phosphohistidine phosphatase